MSGDPVHAIERLVVAGSRLQELLDRSCKIVAVKDHLLSDVERRNTELVELTTTEEKLRLVAELFRFLLDRLVDSQVRSVEDIVSKGLASIFSDLDLGFEASLGTRYNKVSVDFFFRKGSKDHPLSYRGKPLDSFGGGPASVASLILRTLAILRLKLFPLLVLDESLAAVSSAYVEPAARFLHELAHEARMDILLVTHNEGFLSHADGGYRCEEETADGERWVKLRGV